MSDEEGTKNAGDIPWIEPEEGVHEIYANVVHVNWSAYDIRIRLGQLVITGKAPGSQWAVREDGAVTMAYGQAKYLRNLLHGLIKDYEAKNGEVLISPIWPTPSEPLEPS